MTTIIIEALRNFQRQTLESGANLHFGYVDRPVIRTESISRKLEWKCAASAWLYFKTMAVTEETKTDGKRQKVNLQRRTYDGKGRVLFSTFFQCVLSLSPCADCLFELETRTHVTRTRNTTTTDYIVPSVMSKVFVHSELTLNPRDKIGHFLCVGSAEIDKKDPPSHTFAVGRCPKSSETRYDIKI